MNKNWQDELEKLKPDKLLNNLYSFHVVYENFAELYSINEPVGYEEAFKMAKKYIKGTNGRIDWFVCNKAIEHILVDIEQFITKKKKEWEREAIEEFCWWLEGNAENDRVVIMGGLILSFKELFREYCRKRLEEKK